MSTLHVDEQSDQRIETDLQDLFSRISYVSQIDVGKDDCLQSLQHSNIYYFQEESA